VLLYSIPITIDAGYRLVNSTGRRTALSKRESVAPATLSVVRHPDGKGRRALIRACIQRVMLAEDPIGSNMCDELFAVLAGSIAGVVVVHEH
jgi:hypothetical protein